MYGVDVCNVHIHIHDRLLHFLCEHPTVIPDSTASCNFGALVHCKAPPPHLLQWAIQEKIFIQEFCEKISNKVAPWKMMEGGVWRITKP